MKSKTTSTKLLAMLITLSAALAICASLGINPVVNATGAHASQGFTNARLNGTYGGLVQGQIFGAPNGPVQFAAMPVITFDGTGNFSGVITSSFDGTISTVAITGSYQVNPDGTGSLINHFPGGLPDAHVDFVILENGKRIASIQTDPGHVNFGTLDKQ